MTRRHRVGVLVLAAAVVGAGIALPVVPIGTSGTGSAPGAAVAAPADDPVIPPEFVLRGAGWGHGVGMPQWGAFGMAQAGYDAASIVTYYYQGTTVAPMQDDMDIRVNLLYQTGTAWMRSEPLEDGGGAIEVTVGPNVVVGGPADEFRFTVRDAGVGVERRAGGQVADLGSAATVTVRWAGTRTPGSAAGGATLLNVAGSSAGLGSSGHRYRYGSVDISTVSTKKGVRLNVVNSVRLHDEYLYGIAEVSSSWPDAALQAQALAARTYALSKVAGAPRTACACHVDDGGGPYYDQTFTGWGKASAARGERWLAAVNATMASENAGLAILYNGQPIRAFYSSSSGGATQSSQDVWGGALPYAVSVADPWSLVPENPNHAWAVTVSQQRMAQAFGVPVVMNLAVAERYSSGAAKTMAAVAGDGTTVTMAGPKFQSIFGLKSRHLTAIEYAGAPPAPPAPAPPATTAPPAPAPPAAPPGPTVKQRTVSLLTPTAVEVRKGGRYKVVGVVRPAKAKLKAWRQQLVGGEWVTVAKDRTNPKGRYRFVVRKTKANTAGTYRVLVVRKKAVVGVSPEFTVAVR
ncbi:MAG: SpoIID/LytB domain-containing protein [Actinomycetales bacterium]|nr:SpoIID/LytB domain-containing protein [Actinomycetales bacterium]